MLFMLDYQSRIEVLDLRICYSITTLLTAYKGSWNEYAVCPERLIALKPPSLSFEDAAAIPLAASTALQALNKYHGDLSGKTVFVPAGCMSPPPSYFHMPTNKTTSVGGTGSFACQLAKKCFHAGKVITTVSTAKVPKVPELLGEGTVDESALTPLTNFGSRFNVNSYRL